MTLRNIHNHERGPPPVSPSLRASISQSTSLRNQAGVAQPGAYPTHSFAHLASYSSTAASSSTDPPPPLPARRVPPPIRIVPEFQTLPNCVAIQNFNDIRALPYAIIGPVNPEVEPPITIPVPPTRAVIGRMTQLGLQALKFEYVVNRARLLRKIHNPTLTRLDHISGPELNAAYKHMSDYPRFEEHYLASVANAQIRAGLDPATQPPVTVYGPDELTRYSLTTVRDAIVDLRPDTAASQTAGQTAGQTDAAATATSTTTSTTTTTTTPDEPYVLLLRFEIGQQGRRYTSSVLPSSMITVPEDIANLYDPDTDTPMMSVPRANPGDDARVVDPVVPRGYPTRPTDLNPTRDAVLFQLRNTVGAVRFQPHEAERGSYVESMMIEFQIYPMTMFSQFPRHIPYTSKRAQTAKEWCFIDLNLRKYFEVFQYTFRVPGFHQDFAVIWDYNLGLVRLTPFFKALRMQKTAPRTALEKTPGLLNIAISITGGSLAAQGYWLPFIAARAFLANFCYEIRFALVPLFGVSFLKMCLHPTHPNFGRFMIDPAVIRLCYRQTHVYMSLEHEIPVDVLTRLWGETLKQDALREVFEEGGPEWVRPLQDLLTSGYLSLARMRSDFDVAAALERADGAQARQQSARHQAVIAQMSAESRARAQAQPPSARGQALPAPQPIAPAQPTVSGPVVQQSGAATGAGAADRSGAAATARLGLHARPSPSVVRTPVAVPESFPPRRVVAPPMPHVHTFSVHNVDLEAQARHFDETLRRHRERMERTRQLNASYRQLPHLNGRSMQLPATGGTGAGHPQVQEIVDAQAQAQQAHIQHQQQMQHQQQIRYQQQHIQHQQRIQQQQQAHRQQHIQHSQQLWQHHTYNARQQHMQMPAYQASAQRVEQPRPAHPLEQQPQRQPQPAAPRFTAPNWQAEQLPRAGVTAAPVADPLIARPQFEDPRPLSPAPRSEIWYQEPRGQATVYPQSPEASPEPAHLRRPAAAEAVADPLPSFNNFVENTLLPQAGPYALVPRSRPESPAPLPPMTAPVATVPAPRHIAERSADQEPEQAGESAIDYRELYLQEKAGRARDNTRRKSEHRRYIFFRDAYMRRDARVKELEAEQQQQQQGAPSVAYSAGDEELHQRLMMEPVEPVGSMPPSSSAESDGTVSPPLPAAPLPGLKREHNFDEDRYLDGQPDSTAGAAERLLRVTKRVRSDQYPAAQAYGPRNEATPCPFPTPTMPAAAAAVGSRAATWGDARWRCLPHLVPQYWNEHAPAMETQPPRPTPMLTPPMTRQLGVGEGEGDAGSSPPPVPPVPNNSPVDERRPRRRRDEEEMEGARTLQMMSQWEPLVGRGAGRG